MEPQIQYVTTSDGVSIAYYAIGQGPATLFLMSPWSHLEAEWRIDFLRMTYTAVTRRSTLVRLDPRGFGLSDRDPADFGLDGFVLDIEAVVDRLELDELRVLALGLSNVPGLAYTARHPDKVTHLVQFPPGASWEDLDNNRIQKIVELARVDWELGSETLIRTLYPEFTNQQVTDFTGLLRDSLDFTRFERFADAMPRWNTDADAGSVSTPTLLMHYLNNPNFNMATTRRVAGLIKDSRVAFVDGAPEALMLAQRFFENDAPDVVEPSATRTAPSPEAGAMRTILFTDVEGSTALTDRLGDAKARDLLREHERIVRKALKEHDGSEVKTMGDGFMASFTSASKALECAIALQRAFAGGVGAPLAAPGAGPRPIRIRIGLNAGEPIQRMTLTGAATCSARRSTKPPGSPQSPRVARY